MTRKFWLNTEGYLNGQPVEDTLSDLNPISGRGCMGIETIIKLIEFGYAIGKRVPGFKKAVKTVKARQVQKHYQALHINILHSMRRFTSNMGRVNWHREPEKVVNYANDLCTKMREMMGSLLSVEEHDLHCCLKLLRSPVSDDGSMELMTFARSVPLDERCQEAHGVLVSPQRSTILAALTGEDDGHNHWRRVPCFCCPDLPAHFDKFKAPRSDWSTYYKSTLVFPLRYVRNHDQDDFDNIGFLAFDSPKTGILLDMPDVFKYLSDPAGYKNCLTASSVFHLGAIFADSLSAHFYAIYNNRLFSEGADDENKADFSDTASDEGTGDEDLEQRTADP